MAREYKGQRRSESLSFTRPRAGLAQAQYNLGVMYANGQGIPKDEAKAASWYRKAADQGEANAQARIAAMAELEAAEQQRKQELVRLNTEFTKMKQQRSALDRKLIGVLGTPDEEQKHPSIGVT